MDVQKLNLGLTLELMNRKEDKVSINTFKNFMDGVKGVGKFLGMKLKNERKIGKEWKNSDYALNFENCTLEVNLTANMNTSSEILRSFKFK